MKRLILISSLATILLWLDGLQLTGSLSALAQQGGGNGGSSNNSDNDKEQHKLNDGPFLAVSTAASFIGQMWSQGYKNTIISGTWEGRDSSGDPLNSGGNATAGGWGGEKP